MIVTGKEPETAVYHEFDGLPVQVEALPLWAGDPSIGLKVVFTHESSGRRRTLFLWDATLSNLIYGDENRLMAAAFLKHWYGRHVREKRPAGEQAPELVATPGNSTGQSHFVLTYSSNPGLEDLVWFPQGEASARPRVVRWSTGYNGSIASGGPAWPRLLTLTSQLLEASPEDFPSELQLTLGGYSKTYARAFLLFGPLTSSEDDPVLVAGLEEAATPYADGTVVLPAEELPTGLRTATRQSLACRVSRAHLQSLNRFGESYVFDPSRLADIVFRPEGARTRYGLAHDPVPAIFADMDGC